MDIAEICRANLDLATSTRSELRELREASRSFALDMNARFELQETERKGLRQDVKAVYDKIDKLDKKLSQWLKS